MSQGGTCRIHDGGGGGGGPMELYNANPKKYMSLKFYTQKNTWHQNFLPQKVQDLAPYTDLYNQKKKKCDRSLDPKKYQGCKFSTQKNTSDLPVMYAATTPLGLMLTKDYQV